MPNFFNKYPYTDFHEINLDWIIGRMKQLEIDFDEFKVVNNITFSGQWDITKQYPAWTIVSDNNIGYVSQKPVPVGVPLTNGNYWVEVIDYTAQIAGLENRVITLENTVGDSSSGLVKDVDDLQAYVNMLIDHKVFWVGVDCEYTTINAAISAARNVCSETNRALLIIKPGTYNEQITLQPNPGIDMIGYGATVISQADYPDSPLYTSGNGTFIGIEFYYNGTGNNYGCHVEHSTPLIPAHKTTFINCTFRSQSHNGLGVGMSPGSTLELINCEAITMLSSGKAGAYIHNYDGDASQQNLIMHNCIFKGSDNYDDIVIHDATKYPTEKNKSSILLIEAVGCTGHTDSTIRFQAKPSTNPQANEGYIVTPTENIRLSNKSVNNDFIALNVRSFQPFEYQLTVPIAPNGEIAFPAPLDGSCYNYQIISKEFGNGTTWNNLGTPVIQNSNWIFATFGLLPANSNCKVRLRLAPKMA